MSAISIRQARESADVVQRPLRVAGAVVELCAFPEARAGTLQMVEPQSLLLLDLGRYLAATAQRARRRRGGLSARALRIDLSMIETPGPASSLNAMAEHCSLSPAHCIRCIHQSTSISHGAAIRRKRIDRAKAMLTEDHGWIDRRTFPARWAMRRQRPVPQRSARKLDARQAPGSR